MPLSFPLVSFHVYDLSHLGVPLPSLFMTVRDFLFSFHRSSSLLSELGFSFTNISLDSHFSINISTFPLVISLLCTPLFTYSLFPSFHLIHHNLHTHKLFPSAIFLPPISLPLHVSTLSLTHFHIFTLSLLPLQPFTSSALYQRITSFSPILHCNLPLYS